MPSNTLKLKEQFNRFLNLLINEDSFSCSTRWFYPLINRPSPVVIVLAKKLVTIVKSVEPTFSLRLKHNLYDYAILICRTYQILAKQRFQGGTLKKIIIHKEVEDNPYQNIESGYLKPIVDLKKFLLKLSPYFVGAYLHGSLSTLDYIKHFSDVDTLIILKDTVFKNPHIFLFIRNKLIASLKFMYLIDQFQHHNHFLLTEFDLQNYSNNFFPCEILKNAKRLVGAEKLNFKCLAAQQENQFVLKRFYEIISQNNKNMSAMYIFKFYLHYALLFPNLYYQSYNQFYHKKTAITKFLKNPENHFFYALSTLRIDWKSYTFGLNKVYRLIPLIFFIQVIRKLNQPSYKQKQILSRAFKDIIAFSKCR